MRDTSGANTAQEGGDRIALAVNEAYRQANLWWRPDFGGAAITYGGRTVVDGRSFDQLSITPKGGRAFEVWFDTNTHLLAQIHEDRQFFHTRTLFEDYRPENGLTLAHQITLDNGVGEAGYEHFELEKISLGPARPITTYSRPTAPPTGARIEDGAASVSLPFRLLNNHIYVNLSVNGKGPYTFIVDTGGHCLISPELASELGLKIVGSAPTSGAGEKTSTTGFTHVDDIALGSLHMRDQLGFATSIYDPSIEGIRVDGMVGFEMFRRLAVQIDYGRHVITLTDPTRFEPKDAGTAVPFVFYDHLPMVRGFIGDFPARFDIDTGSRAEVDQKMYLKPVEPPQVDVAQFDRSGMWINSHPDGYLVTDVSAQGPAAQAGIQVGDLITRLDGVPPKFDELSQARALLRSRPAGTALAMELKRGTEVKQVTLVLRDQIQETALGRAP